MNGTFYLNSSGSRWVVFVNGKQPLVEFKTKSGKTIKRTPIRFEMFGNLTLVVIRHKGKVVKLFGDEVLDD